MDKKAAIRLFYEEELRKFYYETGIESAVTNFKTDCRIGGASVHVEERLNGTTIDVSGRIYDGQEVPLSVVNAFERHLWYSKHNLSDISLLKVPIERTATFAICISGYVDDGWDNSGSFIEVYDTDGLFVGASVVPDFEEKDSFIWMNRPIKGDDFNSYAPPYVGAEGERLFAAISVADIQQIKKILALGVDIDIRDSNGQNALLLAARIGNVEVLEILIAAGFDVNASVSTRKRGQEESIEIAYFIPLTAAIGNSHTEAVKVLLKAGADANEIDHNMFATPLCIAVEQNQVEITRLLLDAGADPNHYLDSTPLCLAARNGNTEITKILLDAGADVNEDMEDNYRSVMEAAYFGHLEIVKMLVEAGAELDTWSQSVTALSLAAKNRHSEVYNYLYPLTSQEIRQHCQNIN